MMKPEFVSTNSSFRIIIKNVNYYLENSNEPINEPIKLTDKEKLALQLIKENTGITRKEMADRMVCSESTVKRAIEGLVKKNIIHRIGSKKNGSWELITDI